ncbi:MAG: hypothetical protein PHW76_00210 [Alphaproteobacteria bacterium]|nr:hypothetical protein [Alphaproteobacteria bacterium]
MLRVLVILCVVFFANQALAGVPEAREVARLNNCPPKKIEVLQNYPGASGRTLYRVSCALPKAVGEQPGGADTILIECQQSLCALKRPIEAGK